VFTHTIANAKWIEVEAVRIVACHQPDCPYTETQQCPKHVKVENLGVISYWHSNPLRRFAHRAVTALKRR